MTKLGYHFSQIKESLAKIDEELNEFKVEVACGDKVKQQDELGDLFLTLVMTANKLGIDPSEALHTANNKVTARMNFIEKALTRQGLNLKEASLEQMEELWQKAKQAGL
jgi:uncharacterized protein YabN with tetrapyrrole methylase and pyrophosphatase domain